MKVRAWKDADNDTLYYYQKEDGKVVGQTHKVSHTKIWVTKVFKNYNDEHYIGQYIDCESAKKAMEDYFLVQERTLLE